MDLIFTKSETGKSWVAEFKATADFNLHIERLDKGGDIWLYQRTNGGGWDIVNDFANPRYGVIDYDCTALIYPKFIKVVSEVEPTYAAVTSAGEVTEIKSQDKSIEVTSNGTIDVTPDAGFAYLNKVSVKTNVAQSGGEGGGTGGENTYEYIDVRELGDLKIPLAMFSLAVRTKGADYYTMPIASLLTSTDNMDGVFASVKAVMLDMSFVIDSGSDGKYTTREYFTMMGIDLDSLPRLTKEEFYTL